MAEAWTKLSERVHKIGYKWVTVKEFALPNGAETEFTTWYKSGTRSAATVAITPSGTIIVAKQYRPGPEKILYELPGGSVEEAEDLAEAAARELLEETGYASDEPLIAIGQNCADAYMNNVNYYFLAHNCYKQAEQQLDDTEFIEVVELTVAELLTHAKNGLVSDAPALLYALPHLDLLVAS